MPLPKTIQFLRGYKVELITTPQSPSSQGGDEGEVFHRLFTIPY